MRRVEALTSISKSGSLAQLVEQLAFNQFVEGSNPSRPTTLQFDSLKNKGR